MMVTCHSNRLLSSMRPAEKPSTGCFMRSAGRWGDEPGPMGLEACKAARGTHLAAASSAAGLRGQPWRPVCATEADEGPDSRDFNPGARAIGSSRGRALRDRSSWGPRNLGAAPGSRGASREQASRGVGCSGLVGQGAIVRCARTGSWGLLERGRGVGALEARGEDQVSRWFRWDGGACGSGKQPKARDRFVI